MASLIFTNCTFCGNSNNSHSEYVLGTCINCRQQEGYTVCPSCANYTYKGNACLMPVCKLYKPIEPAVNPTKDAQIEVSLGKLPTVYKTECPCGVQHPTKCDYHEITP